MKMLKKIATVLAVATIGTAIFAIDGRTVMQQVLDVKDPHYTHSLVTMDLVSKDGKKESRVVEEYGKSENGLASAVMIFVSPASVKNTRFLQIEKKNGPDDKWIYLPALRTTRRVASSQGDKSFMGTDATYDDMSTRELDEDTHELIKETTDKNGYSCYQVKSTPKDASSAQYKYRMVWIDKKTMLPIYTEMFDKDGKLVKKLTVEKIQNINGYNIPLTNTLENVQTGHKTTLAITKIILDKAIPAKVFTSSFLNTGRL